MPSPDQPGQTTAETPSRATRPDRSIMGWRAACFLVLAAVTACAKAGPSPKTAPGPPSSPPGLLADAWDVDAPGFGYEPPWPPWSHFKKKSFACPNPPEEGVAPTAYEPAVTLARGKRISMDQFDAELKRLMDGLGLPLTQDMSGGISSEDAKAMLTISFISLRRSIRGQGVPSQEALKFKEAFQKLRRRVKPGTDIRAPENYAAWYQLIQEWGDPYARPILGRNIAALIIKPLTREAIDSIELLFLLEADMDAARHPGLNRLLLDIEYGTFPMDPGLIFAFACGQLGSESAEAQSRARRAIEHYFPKETERVLGLLGLETPDPITFGQGGAWSMEEFDEVIASLIERLSEDSIPAGPGMPPDPPGALHRALSAIRRSIAAGRVDPFDPDRETLPPPEEAEAFKTALETLRGRLDPGADIRAPENYAAWYQLMQEWAPEDYKTPGVGLPRPILGELVAYQITSPLTRRFVAGIRGRFSESDPQMEMLLRTIEKGTFQGDPRVIPAFAKGSLKDEPEPIRKGARDVIGLYFPERTEEVLRLFGDV